MRFIDLFQALLDHMRVNLSCSNIRVAQHELDRAEVRTPFKKVRGKTVSQLVRRETPAQAQTHSIIVQDLPNPHAAESPSDPRQKQDLIVRRRTRRSSKFRTALRQVLLDGLDGLASDGHQAFLVSLADASNAADAHVNFRNAEIKQFGNAQSRGIKDLQHGTIPQSIRSRKVWSLKQLVNFIHSEIRRQAAPDFRRLQVFGWVRVNHAFHHREFIYSPERNQIPRHGPAVQLFFVQAGKKINNVFPGGVFHPKFLSLPEKFRESPEVAPIGENRILREASFHAHVAQKYMDCRFHGYLSRDPLL